MNIHLQRLTDRLDACVSFDFFGSYEEVQSDVLAGKVHRLLNLLKNKGFSFVHSRGEMVMQLIEGGAVSMATNLLMTDAVGGLTESVTKKVWVNERLEKDAYMLTLIHECVHAVGGVQFKWLVVPDVKKNELLAYVTTYLVGCELGIDKQALLEITSSMLRAYGITSKDVKRMAKKCGNVQSIFMHSLS